MEITKKLLGEIYVISATKRTTWSASNTPSLGVVALRRLPIENGIYLHVVPIASIRGREIETHRHPSASQEEAEEDRRRSLGLPAYHEAYGVLQETYAGPSRNHFFLRQRQRRVCRFVE